MPQGMRSRRSQHVRCFQATEPIALSSPALNKLKLVHCELSLYWVLQTVLTKALSSSRNRYSVKDDFDSGARSLRVAKLR